MKINYLFNLKKIIILFGNIKLIKKFENQKNIINDNPGFKNKKIIFYYI